MDDILFFEVDDTGIGIKLEDQVKIFTMLRLEDNIKMQSSNGVSLTTAKMIANQLGGDLEC